MLGVINVMFLVMVLSFFFYLKAIFRIKLYFR